MQRFRSQRIENFRALLDTIKGLAPAAAVNLSAQQRWRLPNLHRLLQALHFPAWDVSDLPADVTGGMHDLTRAWLRIAAQAAGLEPDTVGAEAWSWPPGALHDALDLACVRLPQEDDIMSLERLDKDAQAQLPALLSSDSAWIADTAADILWGHTDHAWYSTVTALIPHAQPLRRRSLADLAISLSNDTAAETAAYFTSSDPSLRCAAAGWLDDSDLLCEQALLDPDASVRQAAGAAADDQTIPPAQYWSCPQCAELNEMSTRWCATCNSHGPFPRQIRLSRGKAC